ncbi:MAG: YicC family protein [Alphaproteobacteria bacterium]|nr:YicC family protein [Alphaproteobacteria bacterium]
MTLSSMTGFARAEGKDSDAAWTWELRSVNGRGLDVRLRLPPGFEGVEAAVRDMIAKGLKRGNIQAGLTVIRTGGGPGIAINRDVLEQAIHLATELGHRLPSARPPSVDGMLALRGVIEPAEHEPTPEERAKREAVILKDLDMALVRLSAARAAEGKKMGDVLAQRLGEMEKLAAEAESLAVMQPRAIQERLTRTVTDLIEATPNLSSERLAQEVALLASKADVREELDRLKAHIGQARELLAEGAGVGRRLDFLCQEFNREANTLCSKSEDIALTRVGLSLKAAIEQFREQVQNIE